MAAKGNDQLRFGGKTVRSLVSAIKRQIDSEYHRSDHLDFREDAIRICVLNILLYNSPDIKDVGYDHYCRTTHCPLNIDTDSDIGVIKGRIEADGLKPLQGSNNAYRISEALTFRFFCNERYMSFSASSKRYIGAELPLIEPN